MEFDELVVDDWFHIEQMDDRYWWMHIGHYGSGLRVTVYIPVKGPPKVTWEPE